MYEWHVPQGKAAPTEMSKFKTDYIALPETSLGLTSLANPAAMPHTEGAGPNGTGPSGNTSGPPEALPPPPPLPPGGAAAAAVMASAGGGAAGVALPPPPPLPTSATPQAPLLGASVAAAQAIADRLVAQRYAPQPATGCSQPGSNLPPPPPLSLPLSTGSAEAAVAQSAAGASAVAESAATQAPASASIQLTSDPKAMAANFLSALSADLFGGAGAVASNDDGGMHASEQGTATGMGAIAMRDTSGMPPTQPPSTTTSTAAPVPTALPPAPVPAPLAAPPPATAAASADEADTDLLFNPPLDIFKAIFEADEEPAAAAGDTEGMDAEGQGQQQQQPGAAYNGAGGPILDQAAAPQPAAIPGVNSARQTGLASALLRAQELAAAKAEAARATREAQAGTGTGSGPAAGTGAGASGLLGTGTAGAGVNPWAAVDLGPSTSGPAPGAGADPEVQARIRAALGLLKKSRKEKVGWWCWAGGACSGSSWFGCCLQWYDLRRAAGTCQ